MLVIVTAAGDYEFAAREDRDVTFLHVAERGGIVAIAVTESARPRAATWSRRTHWSSSQTATMYH